MALCIYDWRQQGVGLSPRQSAKLQPNLGLARSLDTLKALCQVGAK
jgi:hypothetical protein